MCNLFTTFTEKQPPSNTSYTGWFIMHDLSSPTMSVGVVQLDESDEAQTAIVVFPSQRAESTSGSTAEAPRTC